MIVCGKYGGNLWIIYTVRQNGVLRAPVPARTLEKPATLMRPLRSGDPPAVRCGLPRRRVVWGLTWKDRAPIRLVTPYSVERRRAACQGEYRRKRAAKDFLIKLQSKSIEYYINPPGDYSKTEVVVLFYATGQKPMMKPMENIRKRRPLRLRLRLRKTGRRCCGSCQSPNRR